MCRYKRASKTDVKCSCLRRTKDANLSYMQTTEDLFQQATCLYLMSQKVPSVMFSSLTWLVVYADIYIILCRKFKSVLNKVTHEDHLKIARNRLVPVDFCKELFAYEVAEKGWVIVELEMTMTFSSLCRDWKGQEYNLQPQKQHLYRSIFVLTSISAFTALKRWTCVPCEQSAVGKHWHWATEDKCSSRQQKTQKSHIKAFASICTYIKTSLIADGNVERMTMILLYRNTYQDIPLISSEQQEW